MEINILGEIVMDDYAPIYDWLMLQNTCPGDVRKKLKDADGGEVDVNISSPGGHLEAGKQIYAMLRSYPGKVKIHVQSQASSSAALVAMAGESDISPVGTVMIHNVSGAAKGDHHDLDAVSREMQAEDRAIASAIAEKTGMDDTKVLALMDKTTVYTAKEAVNAGLIDKIADAANTDALFAANYGTGILPESVCVKVRQMVDKENTDKIERARAELSYLEMEDLK